jgi:2-desacetyl-2-hydroxyethyl bacteriochlorophyllide A dehydrogenase
MKALNIRLNDSKFMLEDIPRPEIGNNPYAPDDVIVEVEYCGICGTELMLYRNGFPKGVLNYEKIGLGHEFSGTVIEIGSQVKSLQPGDRVVGELTTNPCEKCRFCMAGQNNFCKAAGAYMLHQGAYSKFLPIPSRNLHVLPENASFKAGALCQPLSLGVNALKVIGNIQPRDSVVIMGPGPIGLLMVMLARFYEAGTVIVTGLEKDRRRLELACELGADRTIMVNKEDMKKIVMEYTDGQGADMVVEIAGAADAVKNAFEAVRNCGKIVLTGAGYPPLEIDMAGQVMTRQLAVLGCRGDPTPCWTEALRILASGKLSIEPIVSHILPLEKWEEGFKRSMSGETLKVLLTP